MRLTILGTGAWGTALEEVSRRAGSDPLLGGRSLLQKHSLHDFLAWGEFLILAIPAQTVRSHLEYLKPFLKKPLLLVSKGIEQSTGLLLHEVLESICPGLPYGVLSGPHLAHEVKQGLPTAGVIASRHEALAERMSEALCHPSFHLYFSSDVVGVEVGGALKNVIAIGAGILKGQQKGDNAVSTFITRGLEEMVRFGLALKAQPLTFLGLSGVGDLTLTCQSLKSRNTQFGWGLGQGQSVSELTATSPLVEGALTAFSVLERAKAFKLSLPLIEGIAAILKADQPDKHLLDALLTFNQENFTHEMAFKI